MRETFIAEEINVVWIRHFPWNELVIKIGAKNDSRLSYHPEQANLTYYCLASASPQWVSNFDKNVWTKVWAENRLASSLETQLL